MKTVDLAILGGGCAGLSLARDLARRGLDGAPVPSTVVIEPRESYHNDRTWCFWQAADDFHPLATKSWSKWRFSSGRSVHTHQSDAWSYRCVAAGDFYEDAVRAISGSRQVRLQLGVAVTEVFPGDDTLLIGTSEGYLRAREVVDTRPPEAAELSQSRLYQQFAGAEIECELPIFSSDTVRLMEHMATSVGGLRFDYVLPLSPNRLLVEATRFSPTMLGPDRLQEDLEVSLERVAPDGGYRILRREQGLIPMGLPESTKGERHPKWTEAGTRGGAVRAASGYAFRRIENWSDACASNIVSGAGAISPPSEKRFQRTMDNLLLDLLRGHPELGPTVFTLLAQNVPADALVRFLSDEADHTDLLTVIRALPPFPFLRQLATTANPFPRRRVALPQAA